MAGYLIVDIETIPDPRMPFEPPSYTGSAPGTDPPLPPHYHQVVCIGCLAIDGSLNVSRMGIVGKGALHSDEPKLISEFSSFVGAVKPTIITWNGRSFDIPVLLLRAFRHGIPFSWYFNDREYRYRYASSGHLDLMDILANYGASRMLGFRQDVFAKSIGLPGKYGIDGSMVAEYYAAGRIAEIETYCMTDVIQLAFIFLRYLHVKGDLDLHRYQAICDSLLAKCSEEAKYNEMLTLIDRDVLLLLNREAETTSTSRVNSSHANAVKETHETPGQ